jgi:DNA-binding phage protein
MPRVWDFRTGPYPRARRQRQSRRLRDLAERIGIELRRDLALEPCFVALIWMLARPAAISAVGVADRLAWRTAYAGAAPWIIYTAEMLSATDVLAYRSAEEKLDALRAAVRAAEIKRVARIGGVQRSKLQAFVNQGATPHPATIAKILEALDLTQN